MTSLAVPESFELRAARAAALASSAEAAREPLAFAAGLYRVQGRIATALAGAPLTGRLEQDLSVLAPLLGEVLRHATEHGPPALGAAAAVSDPPRLLSWWRTDRSGATDYLARAQLRPYAEVLAARLIRPERPEPDQGCKVCGGRPWIAWRRAASDADGAARFLGCALCGTAEPMARIQCPVCAEADPDKLPMFKSDKHPAVRIEACATCHRYVKSIDLTVDARQVPEVDDLVSVSMDLWAEDEGYSRVEPGLAGV